MLDIEFDVMFSIIEDRIENDITDKPRWNSNLTSKLKNLHATSEQLEVLGLYGTEDTVAEYLRTLCSPSFVKIRNFLRGIIIAGFQANKIYICYLIPESILLQPYQEKMETTLYRYLKDMCKTIIFLPSNKVLECWNQTPQHPYASKSGMNKSWTVPNTQEIGDLEPQKLHLILQNQDSQCYSLMSQIMITQKEHRSLDRKALQQYFTECIQSVTRREPYAERNLNQYPYVIEPFIQFELKVKNRFESTKEWVIKQCFKIVYNQSFWKALISHTSPQENELRSTIFHNTIQEFLQCLISKTFYSYYFKKQNSYAKIQDFNWISQLKLDKNDTEIKEALQKFANQSFNKEFDDITYFINKEQEFYLNKCLGIVTETPEDHFLSFNILQPQLDVKESAINMEKSKVDKSLDLKFIFHRDYKNEEYRIVDIFKIQQSLKSEYILIISNSTQSLTKILSYKSDKDMTTLYNIKQSKSPLILFNDQQNIFSIFNCSSRVLEIEMDFTKRMVIRESNTYGLHEQDSIIIAGTYYSYSNRYILINNKNQILTWEKSDLSLQKKNLNRQNSKLQNKSYVSVKSLPNVSYLFFACTDHEFQICDANFVILVSFNINSRVQNSRGLHLQFHLHVQDSDLYIMVIQDSTTFTQTYQLKNIVQNKKLKNNQVQQVDPQKNSNPFLDMIKGSLVKFGPNSDYLSLYHGPTQNYCSQRIYDVIEKYFHLIDIIDSDQLNIITDEINCYSVNTSIFLQIALTRVPIQLCTVQNCQFTPLVNGIMKKIEADTTITAVQRSAQLKFDYLEELISIYSDNLTVLSIIGRQSSGKSYLLNRVFGVRHSVAASRCTDGIWCSFARIEDNNFIILDCEGLFNQQKNEQEEEMIVQCVTSLSDFTILNQDLSFNRTFNTLFKRLSESQKLLQGELLFKGHLQIIIRDVSVKDREGAEDELIESLDQVSVTKNNFIQSLFNSKINTFLMCNHEINAQFQDEVKRIRSYFCDKSNQIKRWQGIRFFDSLKIVLAQLELLDGNSLDDLYEQRLMQQIKQKANILWNTVLLYSGDIIRLTNDYIVNYELLKARFIDLIKGDLSNTNIYNDMMKIIDDKIQELFQGQIKKLEEELPTIYQSISGNDKPNDVSSIIKDYQSLENNFKMCNEKCYRCYLKCTQVHSHVGSDIKEKKSALNAQIGRLIKEQESDQNKLKQCKIQQSMEETEGVIESIQVALCQISNQLKLKNFINLKQNILDEYLMQYHCENVYDIQRWIEFFNSLINSDYIHLEFATLQDYYEHIILEREQILQEIDSIQSSIHSKEELYNQNSQQNKLIQTTISSQQEQLKMEQNKLKKICDEIQFLDSKLIKLNSQQELINQQINYYDFPETTTRRQLTAYNQESYKSSELRITELKENQLRLNTLMQIHAQDINEVLLKIWKQIQIQSVVYQWFSSFNIEVQQYFISEIDKLQIDLLELGNTASQWSNHIKQLQSKTMQNINLISIQSQCYEELQYQIKQNNIKLQSFQQQWESPIQNVKIREEVGLCSSYCNLCKDPLIFCQDIAWHTDSTQFKDHKLSCSELHKEQALSCSGVDIVFIMDTTGSMSPHSSQVQQSVRKIFQKTETYKQVETFFKFAFIGFKDHAPSERQVLRNVSKPYTIIDFQIANKILPLIQGQTFNGGDDAPEAVLDALDAVKLLNWRDHSEKFVFLITDAYPHGFKYHNMRSMDSFYDGCPCGLSEEVVFAQFSKLKLHFTLIQINESLNMTIKEFQKQYKDTSVIKCTDSEYEFSTKIANTIVKQMMALEITYEGSKLNKKKEGEWQWEYEW